MKEGIHDRRDAGPEGYRTGGMQDRCMGFRGGYSGRGFKAGGMQNKRDSRSEVSRKVGMQERRDAESRDAVKEGYMTIRIHDRRVT